MRGGGDVRDAVALAEAGDSQRFREVLRAVVYVGKDVAVDIEQPALLRGGGMEGALIKVSLTALAGNRA
jgi:hypothetical protein